MPGERFFIAEQQRFVAGVHIDFAEVVVVLGFDTACTHELQCSVDFVGELFVATPLGAGGDELLCPRMHTIEVGEPALGEGPYEVERGSRLVVRLHQPLGVGNACGFSGGGVVHDVPTEAGQLHLADLLERRRARFGELASHAAYLHHGHAERIGEHHGHLQDDAQLFADVVGRELFEALGAIAGLQ